MKSLVFCVLSAACLFALETMLVISNSEDSQVFAIWGLLMFVVFVGLIEQKLLYRKR